MADILIRGMEMPKNCSLCKLAQHRMLACSVMCPITGQTVGYYDEGFHQEDHICPLVPLPEGHGRLGDLDKLDYAFTALRFNEDGSLKHWDDRKNWCLHGSEIETLLANAPTIVPAEGGGEDGN